MSPGRWSALPHLSSHAAIASGSRCYSPISSASCGLAGLDCAARAAHKMSSHSAPLRRISADLQSSSLDRRRQHSRALRNQCLMPLPLIERPPESASRGRSGYPTTKMADFCNKIGTDGSFCSNVTSRSLFARNGGGTQLKPRKEATTKAKMIAGNGAAEWFAIRSLAAQCGCQIIRTKMARTPMKAGQPSQNQIRNRRRYSAGKGSALTAAARARFRIRI